LCKRELPFHVEVLDKENFEGVRQRINIPELTQASGLAACQDFNCLYVSDIASQVIHRVDLSTKSVTNWIVIDEPRGISLTREHNLIITLRERNSIAEYTTAGELVREIRLDEYVKGLQHCVQLSTGQFVVCHSGYPHHGVTIVDAEGRRPAGSSTGRWSEPRGLAVYASDNILVADCYNDKVRLLSSTLTHLHDVTLPNYQLRRPYSVHLDKFSDRLYIGEGEWGSDNNRLFVLNNGV